MKNWIKTNFWNLFGAFIGITGLLTGYIFYVASLRAPGIAIKDVTTHVRIINSQLAEGGTLRLIRKDGVEIKRDIYISTLSIWNSGNTSIKSDALLKPVRLFLPTDSELLEARITKASRPDVTGVTLTPAVNEFTLKWNILEPEDGASIQVIYLANAPVKFGIDGVIEGVKKFNDASAAPLAGVLAAYKVIRALLIIFAGIGGILGILHLIDKFKVRYPIIGKIAEHTGNAFGVFCFLFVAFIVVFGFYSYYNDSKSEAIQTVPDTIK
jgi:hypothetical protein